MVMIMPYQQAARLRGLQRKQVAERETMYNVSGQFAARTAKGGHMTIIEWLRDKNSTENKDNILAPCMDAQTAVNFLIDYLIGDDWYVAYSACTEQVNTEAVMFILQKFSRKYKEELKAWNRRADNG